MAAIGQFNRLCVLKQREFGAFLDGEELGEILLPRRYVPADCAVGDELDVFVHLDSDDCLIATTETPLVRVGECAHLRVVEVNKYGAFLDWGLPKDLLVPFNEQNKPMEEGKSYTVYVYLDPYTERIVASSKLNKFLSEESHYFKPQQAVELLVCGRSDMGFKAVVNNTHLGLIFAGEVFQPLKLGQRLKGYIKNIRADKKIDLCLQLPDKRSRDNLSARILSHLKAHNGVSMLTDKSPPEAIYREYGVSKGNYKKALGGLYKQRLIVIEKDRIVLA